MTTSYTTTILHITTVAVCSFLLLAVFPPTVSAAETPAEVATTDITTRSTGDIRSDIRVIREKIAALEEKKRLEENAHARRVTLLQSQIAEVRGKLIELRQESAVDSNELKFGKKTVRSPRKSERAPELREVIGQPPMRSGTRRVHAVSHGDYFMSLRGEGGAKEYRASVKDAKMRIRERNHLRREIAEIRGIVRTLGTAKEGRHRHPETGRTMSGTELRKHLRERVASLRRDIRSHAGEHPAPRVAVAPAAAHIGNVARKGEDNEKILLEIRDSIRSLRNDIAELRAMRETAGDSESVKATPVTVTETKAKSPKSLNAKDRLKITPRDSEKDGDDDSSSTVVTIIIIIILLILISFIPLVQYWKKKKQQQHSVNQWKI